MDEDFGGSFKPTSSRMKIPIAQPIEQGRFSNVGEKTQERFLGHMSFASNKLKAPTFTMHQYKASNKYRLSQAMFMTNYRNLDNFPGILEPKAPLEIPKVSQRLKKYKYSKCKD